MDRKEIGIRIKKLREDRGFTKYRLAADAGVSPGYISDLEFISKGPFRDRICGKAYCCRDENFDAEKGDGKIGGRSFEVSDRLSRIVPGRAIRGGRKRFCVRRKNGVC